MNRAALTLLLVLVLLLAAACVVPCPYPKPLMCEPQGTPIPDLIAPLLGLSGGLPAAPASPNP